MTRAQRRLKRRVDASLRRIDEAADQLIVMGRRGEAVGYLHYAQSEMLKHAATAEQQQAVRDYFGPRILRAMGGGL